MNFLKFIKDFIARKKLIRFYKLVDIWRYDMKSELAKFWDTPAFMPENSNKKQYEKLVSVNTFGGFTGSGAISDFLAEFENECTVLGGGDSLTHTRNALNGNVVEFIYFILDGSVLTLEENIFAHKFFYSRHAAQHFSEFVIRNYFSGLWIFDDYYLQRSKKFLFDLIDCHWRWPAGYWKNGITINNNKDKTTEHLKLYQVTQIPKRIAYNDPNETQIIENIWNDMSLKEFRLKARQYLKDWFKHFPSNKFLVLDQFSNTGNFDGELFSDYFEDMKIICVYRDPRDMYERCKWSPMYPKDPTIFAKRFKKVANNLINQKHPNLLIIRFEEFITEYDRISKQIIDFLGLDPAKHTKKFYYFDPKISAKKIGIHKTYHDQEAIKIIERELKEYCWDK